SSLGEIKRQEASRNLKVPRFSDRKRQRTSGTRKSLASARESEQQAN
ncbi:hypothetical protein A2U01_0109071, partial [Trifolium medium]|nr:hypothetical protein [Trifolium medium]